MEEKIIRETLREILLKELIPYRKIIYNIDEFGRLSDKLDTVMNELEQLNSEYRIMEEELRPVLEELQSFDQKSNLTNNYLLYIGKEGKNRYG